MRALMLNCLMITLGFPALAMESFYPVTRFGACPAGVAQPRLRQLLGVQKQVIAQAATPQVPSSPQPVAVPGNVYRGGPLPKNLPNTQERDVLMRGQRERSASEKNNSLVEAPHQALPMRHPFFQGQGSVVKVPSRDELMNVITESREIVSNPRLSDNEKIRQLDVRFGMQSMSGGDESLPMPPSFPPPGMNANHITQDQGAQQTIAILNKQREQIQNLLRSRDSMSATWVLSEIDKVLNPPPPPPPHLPSFPIAWKGYMNPALPAAAAPVLINGNPAPGINFPGLPLIPAPPQPDPNLPPPMIPTTGFPNANMHQVISYK